MQERIALVTGANRGIGKEIARQLADLGWQVIAGGRQPAAIQMAAEELGPRVMPVVCDIRRLDQCALAAALVESRFGRLDVLVNNAGIIGNQAATAFDLDQMAEVMETNLNGALYMTRAMWPLLLKSKDARVINISSGMGSLEDIARGDYAAYRLSKWSLNGWTMLLAGDAPPHIRVNAMCPGWVKTDMGGPGATRPVEKGAETAVWLATEPDIPSGKFWRDKAVIPW
ncbi:MAG: SDR family NAD(P)-dependent oxidoreductase [Saprospiraceae bacterium]